MSDSELRGSTERTQRGYRILEHPAIYRFAQVLLAPGFKRPFVSAIDAVAAALPRAKRILDVGCGPDSWVNSLGDQLVGVDTQLAYLQVLRRSGHTAVLASAVQLPFPSRSFNAVWSFSLLHHLTDEGAGVAIAEMLRVCRPDGHVVIWDIVLPSSAFRHPIAWGIRKLDRGGRVRSRGALRVLLPNQERWLIRDLRYTLYGLEGCFCVRSPDA